MIYNINHKEEYDKLKYQNIMVGEILLNLLNDIEKLYIEEILL